MIRIKTGFVRRKKHKKILKLSKGFKNACNNRFKVAKETVQKAQHRSSLDRRKRRSKIKKIWITRLSAYAKDNNLNYAKLCAILKQRNIMLNKKMLSILAQKFPVILGELIC